MSNNKKCFRSILKQLENFHLLRQIHCYAGDADGGL